MDWKMVPLLGRDKYERRRVGSIDEEELAITASERVSVYKISEILQTWGHKNLESKWVHALPIINYVPGLRGLLNAHCNFWYPMARHGKTKQFSKSWPEACDMLQKQIGRLKELTEDSVDVESTRARDLLRNLEQSIGKAKVEDRGYEYVGNLREIRRSVGKLSTSPLIVQVHGFASQASKTYFDFVRIRLSYALACSFFLVIAISSGLLMEMFFAAFVDYSEIAPQDQLIAMLSFFMLPWGILMIAFIGDEMVDLTMDVFDSPSLNVFQSTLLTSIYNIKRETTNRPPSRNMCLVLDVLVVGLVEVWPLIYAVSSPGFWLGYVQGSLGSALLFTVVFLVSDLYNALIMIGDRSSFVVSMKEWIHKLLNTHEVQPGCLRFFEHNEGFVSAWESLNHDKSNVHDLLSNKVYSLRTNPYVYIASLIWGIASYSICREDAHESALKIAVVLVIVTAMLSKALCNRFPSIIGPPYFAILCIFCIAAAGCCVLNAQTIQATDVSNVMVMPQMQAEDRRLAGAEILDSGLELPKRWLGAPMSDRYRICQNSWGSPDSPLSALELGELSVIAYEPDCNKAKEMLEQAFPKERNATLEKCNEYNAFPRWLSFHFPGTNGGRGTRVISVKGTSTKPDIYNDMKLFATIEMIQAFRAIVPLLQLLPSKLVQKILEHVYLNQGVRQLEEQVWLGFKGQVSDLMSRHPDDDFVFTGHSLGGGTAQIVASALKVPALVWSAPGVVYSAKRFNISLQFAKRNIVVVMPDEDAVPRVDSQAGVVQHIECRNKDTGKAYDAMHCHSLGRSICEVWRMCGEPIRDLSKGCAPFVDPRMLGKDFDSDVIS
eukprot:TRINITY_DN27893_c0_g1_i1.p1 TRINITY_DN27893_c0_g1~~TRINITY_DN27893_c0_g1_i1.p1  ORF type:complete len:832 (+),score=104.85 TRINITY_DN27893_c0_g1_i1:100-2595(+)